MIRTAAIVFLLLASLAAAARGETEQPRVMTIGYLEIEDDPRYEERTAYARVMLRSRSRPLPGAEVAIAESATAGRFTGIEFRLVRERGGNVDQLEAALRGWHQQGTAFVLLDLPAEIQAELARRVASLDVLLFNVSSSHPRLRREDCSPRLLHTPPDYAMKADALVQYLVSRNWRRFLLVAGPGDEDRVFATALEESAGKFGARIVERRDFVPGNDPRQRERINPALLTANASYDVVLVADTEGEFARYLPYQTRLPRPVVGSAGLEPVSWSRVYERHGAPQVNDRFERHAGRAMNENDWAAWVAVKSIAQAVLRTASTEFETLRDYLHGSELRVDGAKGPALSYRNWNRQLRQPVFLATHDAVIARAPVDGFLHPSETMDTLGDDAAESPCES